jgi:hypothetical protein
MTAENREMMKLYTRHVLKRSRDLLFDENRSPALVAGVAGLYGEAGFLSLG